MARLKAAGLLIDRRDAQRVRYRRNHDIPQTWVAIIDAVLVARPAVIARPMKAT
jgi:ArsR family transcriptional regulator